MKRFTLLQTSLWLLALCAGIIANIIVLHSYSVEKQDKMQQQVEAYLKAKPSLAIEDSEVVASQLSALLDAQLIVVRDESGNVLAKKENAEDSTLLAQVAQSQFGSKRNQYAISPEGILRVEFLANFKDESSAVQHAFIYTFIIITLLCFIPIASLRVTFSSYRRSITDMLNEIVEQFVSSGSVPELDARSFADSPKKQKLLNHIFPSLNRLSAYLSNQVENIASSAIEIRKEAYKDVVTELGNRNMFVEYYERHIEHATKDVFGCIALVRGTELQHINQEHGYQQGDEYIRSVSEMITSATGSYRSSSVFRLNSSDFAVVLPNTPLKESERFATTLQSKFNQYQKIHGLSSVAVTGLVAYQQQKPMAELLATVDIAMSIAHSKDANGWHIQSKHDTERTNTLGSQTWRKMITQMLEEQKVELSIQPILPLGKMNHVYAEILARFTDDEGQLIPTASLMAMADQLGKSVEVDKLIIERALHAIKNRSLNAQFYGLNLSAASAQNESFVIWLERRLLKEGELVSRLVFELTELGVQQNVKASRTFIAMLHRVGARVTIERFGVGLTSFKFFRELKPDFIKLDASYTRGLEDDKNNQYFVRMMVDLAHRIGVKIFAEGVESQEEKHIIEQLCLDGAQGYYIERPKNI